MTNSEYPNHFNSKPSIENNKIKMCWKTDLWISIYLNRMTDFETILNQHLTEIKNMTKWFQFQDPVHQAASWGRHAMLKRLLESGADPNAPMENQGLLSMPIHWAVRGNEVEAVEILVGYGADPELIGKYGEYLYIGLVFMVRNSLENNLCKVGIISTIILYKNNFDNYT